MRRVHVSDILERGMYDAQRMLHEGRTRECFNHLARKLLEIQRMENRPRDFNVVWNNALQTMHDNQQDAEHESEMSEVSKS